MILKSGLLTVIDMLVIISCAPKIGPVLFDPLIYESQNSLKTEDAPVEDLSDDWLSAILRRNDPTDETTKKLCQSYDYDVTQCKYINDRKICGYNKNKGKSQTEEIKDMGNGCRIRNNRLECGYLIGPFKNIRRPPANNDEVDNTPNPKLRVSSKTSQKQLGTSEKASNTRTITEEDPVTLENDDDIEVRTKRNISESTTIIITDSKIINTTSSALTTHTESNKENVKQRRKYCVEKSDRIFCYTAK